MDILVSCVATTLLCIWSSVCVNVPNQKYGAWDIARDKWHMLCLGSLAPENILLLALGQYSSALSTYDAFKASKFPSEYWTMRHAFFADMGGFILCPKDWTPFPIDGKQLHYLVTFNRRGTDEKYLKFPEVLEETIKDRNKSSGLARCIPSTFFHVFTKLTLPDSLLSARWLGSPYLALPASPRSSQ